MGNFKTYLKNLPKRYFIDAFSGMSLGLFATLISGTILSMVAGWIGNNTVGTILSKIATMAKVLMGAGIGIGIAYKLNAKPLVIFSSAICGLVGAFSMNFINLSFNSGYFMQGSVGNPIGAYVVSLLCVEIASLYAGKTQLDIIFIPIGMILLSIIGIYVAWPFIKLIDLLAELLVITINAGSAVKIIVGVFVAVVMGILLTMPTSSAAIWVAIAGSTTAINNPEVFSIAGGAAVAGCAAHMVGFAVTSFRENKIGGLISQGLGTSMLQIPNIMKKPVIMLPEIIASAFSGLLAVVFNLRCNAAGGGMGTSGLVGIFGAIEASTEASVGTLNIALGISFCFFIIPVCVSLFVSELLRSKGIIKFGDMKITD